MIILLKSWRYSELIAPSRQKDGSSRYRPIRPWFSLSDTSIAEIEIPDWHENLSVFRLTDRSLRVCLPISKLIWWDSVFHTHCKNLFDGIDCCLFIQKIELIELIVVDWIFLWSYFVVLANFRLRSEKEFETASLNGQIPPLLTSLRLTSLHVGFPIRVRKIAGSYQKSAASGGQLLPHSVGNFRDRLAIASHFSLLTPHFSLLTSDVPPHWRNA
jgi:hypothetical protein